MKNTSRSCPTVSLFGMSLDPLSDRHAATTEMTIDATIYTRPRSVDVVGCHWKPMTIVQKLVSVGYCRIYRHSTVGEPCAIIGLHSVSSRLNQCPICWYSIDFLLAYRQTRFHKKWVILLRSTEVLRFRDRCVGAMLRNITCKIVFAGQKATKSDSG